MNEECDYHLLTHGVDKDGHVAKFDVSVFEALQDGLDEGVVVGITLRMWCSAHAKETRRL